MQKKTIKPIEILLPMQPQSIQTIEKPIKV